MNVIKILATALTLELKKISGPHIVCGKYFLLISLNLEVTF
jgi:hypothetical protein